MRSRARRRFALTALAIITALASLSAQQPTDKVYVTKAGAKYHRATCSSLAKSKIEMTLADASARYAPCKVCKPPILASNAPAQVAATSSAQAPAARAATVESGRCQATTKKGTQCSRKAKPGSKYCWQHGG